MWASLSKAPHLLEKLSVGKTFIFVPESKTSGEGLKNCETDGFC